MNYTPKQRKVKEYMLSNIDIDKYLMDLHTFVQENNKKGHYPIEFVHTQGYALNSVGLHDLLNGAIEYAGYKQDKADRTWLSVLSVWDSLLNVF